MMADRRTADLAGDDGPAIDPEWFVRPDGSEPAWIHGVAHTQRVLVHVRELAYEAAQAGELGLTDTILEAACFAAVWHDIGRTHDGADYYHGGKSAGKVVGLGLHAGIDPEVVELALFAVTHHSGDEVHALRGSARMPDSDAAVAVLKLLKDADGLDRVRLGDLDVSFLRYRASRTRVARAKELLEQIR